MSSIGESGELKQNTARDQHTEDFNRFLEIEKKRRVFRVIMAILLLLLVFFIRLMPFDWAAGSLNNLLGVSNFFNNQNGAGPVTNPTASEGISGQTDGSAMSGLGDQTNYVVGDKGAAGATGAAGKAGPMGPAGKDGTFTQLGFGQGHSSIGACDDAVDISMRSKWNNGVISGGAFTVTLIRISNVSTECNGMNLMVDLLDTSGTSLLPNPINVFPIQVTSLGEILITDQSFVSLGSVISNKCDKLILEVAA